jgi:hypothetical protein
VTSEELKDLYRDMHQEGHFSGAGCLNYRAEIRSLVRQFDTNSVLDYGCGKGRQFRMKPIPLNHKLRVYAESWQDALGVEYLEGYDPCYPKYAKRPRSTFDGVYCTSVLEHVMEQDVPSVLTDIFSFAEQWVFITVGTTLAKKDLPGEENGNAHVTLKPVTWWVEQTIAIAPSHIIWQLIAEREKTEEEKTSKKTSSRVGLV